MDVSLGLLTNAVISGLLLGGFYAAVSSGVATSFGMLHIVNIAHPALILLGSYVAFIGRAIRAVARAQQALRLMAANPTRIKRIAFGLSFATAALAGAALIIIQPVEPSIGREYIGRIFAICVLGGLGSFPGMVIAAVTLGIVESLTSTFFGPSWAPAVAFGVLLVTLAVRPSGILGR